MTMTVQSYKRTEYKRGYLRVNGTFAPSVGNSKNHRRFVAEVAEGDEIDARGSYFGGGDGRSRWDAPRPQWLRFTIVDGQLKAADHEGSQQPLPVWVNLRPAAKEVAV